MSEIDFVFWTNFWLMVVVGLACCVTSSAWPLFGLIFLQKVD